MSLFNETLNNSVVGVVSMAPFQQNHGANCRPTVSSSRRDARSLAEWLCAAFLLAALTACGGGGGGAVPTTYTIGGTTTGLTGTVVLQNSGSDDLSRSADGSFTFATALANSSAYNVTVLTQPAGQTCNVANGAGNVNAANVTNVAVTCTNNGGGGARTAAKITAGGWHTCAILDTDVVKCWGMNSFGQLGYGDTNFRGTNPDQMGDNLPAVDLGTGRTAVQIAAGQDFTCARLDNGTIKCWGANYAGQLGQGDVNNRGDGPNEMGDNLPAINLGTGRTAVDIAAGGSHACARLDNGTAKCWAQNQYGKLGLGDVDARGNAPNEMGDNLPSIDLGTGRIAVALAPAFDYTCALLDNGAVKCWGRAAKLGLGISGSSNDRGDQANEMGDNLPAVDLGTGRTAVEIAAGISFSTCARLDNGAVKCWGQNGSGELGVGDNDWRGDGANEMGDNLPSVDLGTGRTAVKIATGGNHACARLDNGATKCWGKNFYGQLGQGDTSQRGDAAGELGDNLAAIDLGTGRSAIDIAGGANFNCARLDDGALKCWGAGGPGSLGYGDVFNRGDGPGEMGDNLPAVDLGN